MINGSKTQGVQYPDDIAIDISQFMVWLFINLN